MSRLSFFKSTMAAAGAALLVTLATISLSTTAPAPAHADIPPGMLAATPSSGGVPSLAPLLKGVLPAVVNISVSGKMQQAQNPLLNDPFFRKFFNIPDDQQQPQREFQAIGSGVIVDAAKGYILTNNHVVEKASKIKITLNDDRQIEAKLIGTDPGTDLAVVQIKADNLKQLPLGDSSQLQVGDFVVAIGSPFGLKQTVTSGIVSGLGRTTDDPSGDVQDFIQTDASINPGNSGGALVDLHGQLVGINSQILSGSGGSIGIGFAIPIDLAKSVMTQIIQTGHVTRGRIGIQGGGEIITPEMAKAFNLPDAHGALVDEVVPGSPADKAGLKSGDVIVSVNGKDIRDFQQLRNMVGVLNVGDKVLLKLYRDGKPIETTVAIGKSEASNEAKSGVTPSGDEAGGSKGLSPLLATGTFKASESASMKGIQIVDIDPDSPLAETGLKPGDVILSVNRETVDTMEKFMKLAGPKAQQLLLHVRRGPGSFFLLLQQP